MKLTKNPGVNSGTPESVSSSCATSGTRCVAVKRHEHHGLLIGRLTSKNISAKITAK
jgi:hypothetical protein